MKNLIILIIMMLACAMAQAAIQNGTFTGNANHWELGTGWAYNYNNMRGTGDGGAYTLDQNFGAIQNNYYDLTYTIVDNNLEGVTTLGLHSSGAFGSKSTIPSSVGTHTVQYQATAADPLFDLMFELKTGSTGGQITIDDVSVVDSDKMAPTPDPSTFLLVPTYINGDSVEMTADTATDDVTDVEYQFVVSNDGVWGGDTSSWQSSPYYLDDGLDAGRTYTYTIQVRDKAFVANLTTASAGEDVTPFGLMNGTITGNLNEWSAGTQWTYNDNNVQAFGNSGQDEFAQDFGAVLNAYYDLTYTVVANTLVGDTTIDLGSNGCFGIQNSITSTVGTHTIQLQATNVPAALDLTFKLNAATTGGSIILDDIIIAASDKTPPDPDPATYSLKPVYLDGDSVHMHATPATDDSGPVEYFFDETTGLPGGDDSGWQSSTDYVDIGLGAGQTYTYTVKTRDSALVVNTGTASSGEDVTPWGLMNGTFTGSLDQWEADTQWTYGTNNVVALGNSGQQELNQNFGAVLNEWYRLSYIVIQNSLVGDATIDLAAAGCFGLQNSIDSTLGIHYYLLQATNGAQSRDLMFKMNAATTGGSITLDDVTISRNLTMPSYLIHGAGGGGYRGRYNSRSSD